MGVLDTCDRCRKVMLQVCWGQGGDILGVLYVKYLLWGWIASFEEQWDPWHFGAQEASSYASGCVIMLVSYYPLKLDYALKIICTV